MIVNAKGELGSQTRHQVLALANVFLTLSSVRVSMNVLFYIKTNADVGCFFSRFFPLKLKQNLLKLLFHQRCQRKSPDSMKLDRIAITT